MGDARPPILVVEDDDNDVVLIERAFRRGRLANPLRFVGDGEAGRDYLIAAGGEAGSASHPFPALVLLDLKLPRLSGLELLEWVRARPCYAGLPVVVLTSSRENRDIERAYALGANSYLVKPVAFEALLDLTRAIDHYWLAMNEVPDPRGAS